MTCFSWIWRDRLGLTGTQRGCESGTCGLCSVLVDGALTRSCRTRAADVAGHHVTTIEGIHGPDGGPNDLQVAFLEHGAVQCGFCTLPPWFWRARRLRRNRFPYPRADPSAINGILCRCTGYVQIVDAIEATAAQRSAGEQRP